MRFLPRRVAGVLASVATAATLLVAPAVASAQAPLPELSSGVEEMVEEYQAKFGLDKPLYEQYLNYLLDMARFDFGYSLTLFPSRALDLIMNALPWTIGLLLVTTLLSFAIGTLLGAVIAWPRAPRWVEGLAAPLHRLCEPPLEAWGVVTHLLSVLNSDAWREAQQTLQPEVVAFSLRIAQSRRFYEGYRALRDRGVLDTAQRRIADAAIRAAEQAGVALEGAARDRFNAIQRELAEVGTAFSNAVLDAIKAYSLWVRDPDGAEGLPRPVRALAAAAARDAGETAASADEGPWRITLDAAIAAPFLMHVRDRGRRETLCRAMATKAAAAPHDNTARVERILELRREQASLLGHPHFAALIGHNRHPRSLA